MKISQMNWMQVESYLAKDDRAVVPIGCTEQHAYLSLSTDSILAERVAADAAEPLGVPVFPVIGYGFTPNFMAYPGTVTLRIETLLAIVRDVLDGLASQGFKRILIVNGHGGNAPARSFTHEWMHARSHERVQVKFHDWWNAPRVFKQVQAIDPLASHASWMENFPWTRLEGVVQPREQKSEQPYMNWTHLGPQEIRRRLGDGNFAGLYQRSDDEMYAIWREAVEETRALIDTGWE
jgi:creatinine amidohydrolase